MSVGDHCNNDSISDKSVPCKQLSVHSFWDIILCVVSILMPYRWEGWAVFLLRFIWTASFKRCTDSAVHTLRLHQKTLLKSSNTESFSSNFRTSLTLNFLIEHHDHWRMVSDFFLPPALHFHVTKSFFFLSKYPSLCNVAGHVTVNFFLWRCDPARVMASSFLRLLNDAPQLVGLLWTSDQLVAETSTWQHTTLTTDKHPCPRWDSNPRSQQASGRRPTP